jgi:DUF2934 family protein
MARPKSTSGSKTNRTNANQEPTGTGSPANVAEVKANAADVKSVAAEPAPVDVKPVEVKPEVKIAPEPRKRFEVVKNESRRLVPINLEDEIRRRAYELYQQRGAGSGHEAQDWLIAEREVQQRYHQQQQQQQQQRA